MKLNIAIVADHRRKAEAVKLADLVDADHISMDMGSKGAGANHRDAWNWHQHHLADWCVTLEDDAVPCKDFRHELEKALSVAPAHLVSLYLGKVRPEAWQSTITEALLRADRAKANWLTARYALHGVGIACDGKIVRALTYALALYSVYPPDEALSLWCSRNDVQLAYSVPSLVDHADIPTLIHSDGREAEVGRVAHKTGVRRKWVSDSVPLIAPRLSARESQALVSAVSLESDTDQG
jgi:hypothetical protein